MPCDFCNDSEVKERVILENDLAFAFPSIAPIVEGHVLISPKRHAQYNEELTRAERDSIEELRMELHGAMEKTYGAQGFNYAWNEGIIAGQSIPHFHLHMLPRMQGDTGVYAYEPREFLYRSVSKEERETTKQDELMQVAETIRKNI